MNNVTLVGHVGKTPETITFESGKKVTKFSMATTEHFRENKETNWHLISVWDSYGETIGKLIKTGTQVAVFGRIQYGEYEKDGVKLRTTTIVAEKVELLGKKSDNNSNSNGDMNDIADTPRQTSEHRSSSASATKYDDDNDDLPF